MTSSTATTRPTTRQWVAPQWWPHGLGDGDTRGASTRDAPGTYRAHYAPIAVDRDTVVAVGTTHYTEVPGGPVVRTYDNCFVIRFDSDGQCREFTEYYVRRPD